MEGNIKFRWIIFIVGNMAIKRKFIFINRKILSR